MTEWSKSTQSFVSALHFRSRLAVRKRCRRRGQVPRRGQGAHSQAQACERGMGAHASQLHLATEKHGEGILEFHAINAEPFFTRRLCVWTPL